MRSYIHRPNRTLSQNSFIGTENFCQKRDIECYTNVNHCCLNNHIFYSSWNSIMQKYSSIYDIFWKFSCLEKTKYTQYFSDIRNVHWTYVSLFFLRYLLLRFYCIRFLISYLSKLQICNRLMSQKLLINDKWKLIYSNIIQLYD